MNNANSIKFINISEAAAPLYNPWFTPNNLLQLGIEGKIDIYLRYDWKEVKCTYRKNENGKISTYYPIGSLIDLFSCYEKNCFWKIKDKYFINFAKYHSDYNFFKNSKNKLLNETKEQISAINENNGFGYEEEHNYISILLSGGCLKKGSQISFEPEEVGEHMLVEPYTILGQDEWLENIFVSKEELFERQAEFTNNYGNPSVESAIPTRQTLCRNAIISMFDRLTEHQWDKFFERRAVNGLEKHLVLPQVGIRQFYYQDGICTWLISRNYYTSLELEEIINPTTSKLSKKAKNGQIIQRQHFSSTI